MRKKINFLPKGSSPLLGRKALVFQRKNPFRPNENLPPCGREKISAYIRENTKCSGEGTGREKNISELGAWTMENELREEVKSA
ncbi:hypothetical protein [uncultured Porphyromonas sp.]|uniref:hypothetical protein n=1 Tax=uncultured Porphyromonas sp. TaxID=159274 RepID=UPI00262E529F|nr:hypothetical protein [uncultured Porphyromonas sp.]